MDFHFIAASAVLLFFLLDPFGNLPLFISILGDYSFGEYRRIVVRECFFSLIIMFAALFAGRAFLNLLGLSTGVLRLSGGLILLILSLKMVSSSISIPSSEGPRKKEPFIVPLAVPLICGPGTLVMLMTFLHSSAQATYINVAVSICCAWFMQTLVLLFGRNIANLLGSKMLDALESLMGLLLSTVAIGMLVAGIQEIYGIPK